MFIVPIVISIGLVYFYKKEVVLVETALIVFPSFLIIGICYAISYYSLTNSIEYLGDYAVKITHYDDWDEWVHQTCTRSVPCGVDSKGHTKYRTETYDCSHREYHQERWVMTTSDDSEIYIDKDKFDEIKNKWNAKEIFLDMHRDYYTKDGDAQYYIWDEDYSTLHDITVKHNYINKIKASKSIFAFEDISEKEAKKLELFDYPNVNEYSQNPINGYKNLTDKEEHSIRLINALYGSKYQVRVFINTFYNKDLEISKKQQSYWVGGNKNEFVINVCLDSLTNNLLWVDCFSWMDEPKLEIRTEQYIREQKKFDIIGISDYLLREIPFSWKRKEFKDFDYLTIELTEKQFYITWAILIIYLIASSCFVVLNDIKNEI